RSGMSASSGPGSSGSAAGGVSVEPRGWPGPEPEEEPLRVRFGLGFGSASVPPTTASVTGCFLPIAFLTRSDLSSSSPSAMNVTMDWGKWKIPIIGWAGLAFALWALLYGFYWHDR